jgi:hypothetical protein
VTPERDVFGCLGHFEHDLAGRAHNVSQHTLKSINRAKKELVHALFDKFDEGAHLGQRQPYRNSRACS